MTQEVCFKYAGHHGLWIQETTFQHTGSNSCERHCLLTKNKDKKQPACRASMACRPPILLTTALLDADLKRLHKKVRTHGWVCILMAGFKYVASLPKKWTHQLCCMFQCLPFGTTSAKFWTLTGDLPLFVPQETHWHMIAECPPFPPIHVLVSIGEKWQSPSLCHCGRAVGLQRHNQHKVTQEIWLKIWRIFQIFNNKHKHESAHLQFGHVWRTFERTNHCKWTHKCT